MRAKLKYKRGSFSDRRRFETGGQCDRTYPSRIFKGCPPGFTWSWFRTIFTRMGILSGKVARGCVAENRSLFRASGLTIDPPFFFFFFFVFPFFEEKSGSDIGYLFFFIFAFTALLYFGWKNGWICTISSY